MEYTESALPEPNDAERERAEAVGAVLRERMAAGGGALPFDQFMRTALYEPGLGYYVGGRERLGRGGDFVTAPELTPFFGYTVAGQVVDIHVDTYPGHTWHGQVTSISQASGAEFSVLPPQNATGNWVKVVQRIPIRISIPSGPDAPPLRSGMSTTVEIDTGHQRPLPGFVRTALNWLGGPFAAAADRK